MATLAKTRLGPARGKHAKPDPDTVEIRVSDANHSSGASLAEEAMKRARDWPEKLDLESRLVRREGDEVIFTYKKAATA